MTSQVWPQCACRPGTGWRERGRRRGRRLLCRRRQRFPRDREAFDKWLLYNIRVHKGVIPEQLVLLLELLLDEPDLSLTALRALEKTYHLQDRDAEVRHRWCELVVKHKHTAAYKDVERFLLQDQAMGVYLYGELMVQEDAHQQALARRCFSQAQEEMDPAVRKVVEEMIY